MSLKISCVLQVVSLLVLGILSSSLFFNSSFIMCLSVDLCEFILLENFFFKYAFTFSFKNRRS